MDGNKAARELVTLRQAHGRLETQFKQLAQQALLVEQQRNTEAHDRVTTLKHLLCLLLEYHDGQAEITVPLFDTLGQSEYRLEVKDGSDPNHCLLVVTDATGASLEPDGDTPLAAVVLAGAPAGNAQRRSIVAVPVEPEQPRAERCPECYLAFGEHRPGCSKAAAP
jgi:hypothetical protein